MIQQLTVNLPIVDHAGALHFFRNVSELLDVFERGEVRTELLKELDRQQRKLQTRIGVHGVDQSRIEALIQQLKAAGSVLISAPRIGQFLREDRLIALVRQRLSIPAAVAALIYLHCTFGCIYPGRSATAGRNTDCQPEPAHPGTYHGAGFNSPVGSLP